MNIGVLQLAIAGFCFGFLGIFGKLAFQRQIEIGELLTLRFMTASLILLGILSVFRPRLLKVTLKELAVCALLGALGYAVFSTLYFLAVKGVSVAVASLLLYTFPILVSLGAHFLFKERLTKAQWFAIPIAALGLAVLLGGGSSLEISQPLAVVAGLGSALCYAVYILTSSRLQKNIHPLTSAMYVILFAAIGLALIHRPDIDRVRSFGIEEWKIIVGIALVCTVAPLFLFLSGLQKLGNTQASLLSLLEPVTAAIMGAVVLGEAIMAQTIIGGAIVLCGLAISVGAPMFGRAKTERP
ncbi:MAG: DMT family transporter [Bdellovibrionota bacterium]